MDAPFDVLVIGAGFGGLSTALALAESGARVCLAESLRYPGGCASTFSRNLPGADGARVPHRFEAGATVVSGLGPEQLFGRWLARHAPELSIDWMDPLVELRAPGMNLSIGRDRQALVDTLSSMEGAPREGIASFFREQKRVADVLWELFDDPSYLPPFDARMLARHAARGLRYAPLVPLLGRPLAAVMRRHGVDQFAPLRLYVDALCQITVQCPADEAEAPFALAAMDYYHRGTGHVRGGFGELAWALCRACEKEGVDVRFSSRVRRLVRERDGFFRASVGIDGREIRAAQVAANLLPSALEAIGDFALPPPIAALDRAVNAGWGAVMTYAVAEPFEGARPEAHHLELVRDARRPLTEGNHVFVSISGADETERAPAGRRTLTMSTHVPLRATGGVNPAGYIARIQDEMKETLVARAPEWATAIVHTLPASPRTFERFVGRPHGAVGGVPRRAGLSHYRGLGPTEVLPGLYLVGDSVFPGQSALAVAIGGVRTAAAMCRRIPATSRRATGS